MSAISTDLIRPGTTIGVIEFVRLVADGEVYHGQEIMNRRQNKWWAKIGNDERMVSLDGFTRENLSKWEEIKEWPKEDTAE